MSDGRPVEILMIEDSDEDAELAVRALRKQNLANNVHRVEDGAAALDFLIGPNGTNHRPRVVLLDLKLPKIGGLEVLAKLKTHERTRLLPVVILTSSREGRDLNKAYELGANSYIVKPVDFEKLSRVVGELGMYWVLMNEPLRSYK